MHGFTHRRLGSSALEKGECPVTGTSIFDQCYEAILPLKHNRQQDGKVRHRATRFNVHALLEVDPSCGVNTNRYNI